MNRNAIIHITCLSIFIIGAILAVLSGVEFLKYQPDNLVGPVLVLILGLTCLVLDDELTHDDELKA